ncbi:MAG TPA: DUF3047 domain-containing protein [Burkholderiaceae bacterium]|nr:DUF3047 domain-containing protein [Burkholderiaceae bacterium]
MRQVLSILLALVTGAFFAGCASVAPAPAGAQVAPFSANWPGRDLPDGWQPWLITRAKAPTRYELVVDPQTQKVVLHAAAAKSASGLAYRLDVDPQQQPRLRWDWRVVDLIDTADNTDPLAEDAPVRLMLFFDGDRSKLPVREQVMMDTAKLLTGQDVPYSTLVYVWENRQPQGTVIPNAHTGQIKMLVAGSGGERIDQWQRFERNYVEDYRRAFGADPGRLVGVGILTDTDNTGERTEAYYGDIQLLPPRTDS